MANSNAISMLNDRQSLITFWKAFESYLKAFDKEISVLKINYIRM